MIRSSEEIQFFPDNMSIIIFIFLTHTTTRSDLNGGYQLNFWPEKKKVKLFPRTKIK